MKKEVKNKRRKGEVQMNECKVAQIVETGNMRSRMDQKQLDELTASIKAKGIIQPLIVRPSGKNMELVCGHRRLAAANALKMDVVPVIVKQLTDQGAQELQIVENLQRADINPVDEAKGFKVMLTEHGRTYEDLASQVGKSAAYISDRMQLLKLQAPILKALQAGEITPAHAKVLLMLKDPGERKELFEEILENKMSARGAENSVGSQYGSNYGKDLNRVKFDKTDCKPCTNNGDNYKDLIDPDTQTNGMCFNPECFNKKYKQLLQGEIDKLTAAGAKAVQEKTAFKGTAWHKTEVIGELERKLLGKEFKAVCLKCNNLKVVTNDPGKRPEYRVRCFKPECLKQKTQAGKKVVQREAAADTRQNGPTKEQIAMKKAREENRKTIAARKFWQDEIKAKKTEHGKNTMILDAMLHGMDYNEREQFFVIVFGKSRQSASIRYIMQNMTNERVLKSIETIINNRLEVTQTADLESLAGTVKKTLAKDFEITKDYLEAMTKDGLAALLKELKFKGELNVKKGVLVKYFTDGKVKYKGIVPKEMKKFKAPTGRIY